MTEFIRFAGHILCQQTSELGEGPTFDPAMGTAWWFNIKGKELHELHLESGRKTVHVLPFLGSVLAVIDPARQLIASDEGLFLRDTASGKLSQFATIEDKPGNRSNDGRVHASGALWIGTMGRKADKHAGAIYHVAGSRVTKLYGNITIPNSICFSPDGATAYFTDTDVNHLMRVDIDPATALPTGDPVVLCDESTAPGGLDGSVCDADGLIWNARWGAGAVDVYKPDGQRVARYAVPATQPSCPAFIGAKADRLLVTTAWQDMDDAARAADPDAGKTFDLGITVKGRFEPAFIL
ncbi:SMP-30/gluconolactonase/LRE family protein [Sinorhizobium numidicum]|uniref:SMP-30/gluconolactonase/LRE family protein n=1 Tax=Sinorhizobium numidicum TaxID=680248 RepID=A0ABY8D7W3_9HYPH|nr:SMP-30/gluconolactonase/LRE family protein [Sinorhizobium numidicum]WEX79112.1 SMP-30/gluconolactonase/LRE family protein [Sinorhizobium numidicum]WEX85138.1 SMP-30/gluconolactonase/LRE family protein [Sinorhizobium numidicum]